MNQYTIRLGKKRKRWMLYYGKEGEIGIITNVTLFNCREKSIAKAKSIMKENDILVIEDINVTKLT